MLEASPSLCIYLMMDGHKHHAVAVGEWCFSIVSVYFDLYCEQPLDCLHFPSIENVK